MTNAEQAHCQSCGRAIIWATSPTGARLPLDARPVTVYGVAPQEGYATPLAGKADRLDHSPVYISHFLTCPNAGQHSHQRRA